MSPDAIPRITECALLSEVGMVARWRAWRGCSVQRVGLLLFWWPS